MEIEEQKGSNEKDLLNRYVLALDHSMVAALWTAFLSDQSKVFYVKRSYNFNSRQLGHCGACGSKPLINIPDISIPVADQVQFFYA